MLAGDKSPFLPDPTTAPTPRYLRARYSAGCKGINCLSPLLLLRARRGGREDIASSEQGVAERTSPEPSVGSAGEGRAAGSHPALPRRYRQRLGKLIPTQDFRSVLGGYRLLLAGPTPCPAAERTLRGCWEVSPWRGVGELQVFGSTAKGWFYSLPSDCNGVADESRAFQGKEDGTSLR